MVKYIEGEAAFNAVLKLVPKVDDDGYCWVIRGDAAKAVDSIPAADVVPVRHGRWIDTDNYYMRWKCSECGNHTRDARPPYCPNCGADMREIDDGRL